jgi:hypothetical protein
VQRLCARLAARGRRESRSVLCKPFAVAGWTAGTLPGFERVAWTFGGRRMIGWSGLPRQCEAFDSFFLAGEGRRCNYDCEVTRRSECRAGVVRPEFEFERNRTGEGSGNAVRRSRAGLRESCEFGLVGLFVCRAELAAWWSYGPDWLLPIFAQSKP